MSIRSLVEPFVDAVRPSADFKAIRVSSKAHGSLLIERGRFSQSSHYEDSVHAWRIVYLRRDAIAVAIVSQNTL
jgi:hypothetical protein